MRWLLLVGILVDSVCQWLILGTSYLGAALLVGPVLIAVGYALLKEWASDEPRAAVASPKTPPGGAKSS